MCVCVCVCVCVCMCISAALFLLQVTASSRWLVVSSGWSAPPCSKSSPYLEQPRRRHPAMLIVDSYSLQTNLVSDLGHANSAEGCPRHFLLNLYTALSFRLRQYLFSCHRCSTLRHWAIFRPAENSNLWSEIECYVRLE